MESDSVILCLRDLFSLRNVEFVTGFFNYVFRN